MKLELKAYKVTFPSWNEEAFNTDIWDNPDKYDVIYGKTQREALTEFCKGTDIGTYWEAKKNARARRFKDMDLFSQDPAPILQELSKVEISHLTHSLGVETGERFIGQYYRDYSVYYDVNEDFNKLIDLGLVETYKKFDSHVYKVTEKGKEPSL